MRSDGLESQSNLQKSLFEVASEYSGQLPPAGTFVDTPASLKAQREAFSFHFPTRPVFFTHPLQLATIHYPERGAGSARIGLDVYSLKPLSGSLTLPERSGLDEFADSFLPELFTSESIDRIKSAAVHREQPDEQKGGAIEAVILGSICQSSFQAAMRERKIYSPDAITTRIEATLEKIPDPKRAYGGLYLDLYDFIGAASIHRHFFRREENEAVWGNLEQLVGAVIRRKAAVSAVARDSHIDQPDVLAGLKADLAKIQSIQKGYQRKAKQ